MRKMRKGFTLLELLVVIGVMGLMSSMAMIAGQQTTDAARATNIADGLEKAASAMMMYYSDNADVIAVDGIKAIEADDTAGISAKSEAEIVAEGANAYLKKSGALVAKADSGMEGKYAVEIEGTAPAQTWWVLYTLATTDTAGIGPIMQNKTARMGLKQEAKATDAKAYEGGAVIYMQVR